MKKFLTLAAGIGLLLVSSFVEAQTTKVVPPAGGGYIDSVTGIPDGDIDMEANNIGFDDGSSSTAAIILGDGGSVDAQIYFNGSALVLDVDGGTVNDVLVALDGAGSIFTVESSGINGSLFQIVGQNATASNGNFVRIAVTTALDPEGNTINMLQLDWNDLEWTAEATNMNAIEITGITADSDGISTALKIGAGWDYGLSILGDGSAVLSNITLGASRTADAQIYFDGANLVFDVDGTVTNDFIFEMGGTTSRFTVQDSGNNNTFYWDSINVASVDGRIGLMDTSILNALNGGDRFAILELDHNETEFATGTGNNLNALYVTSITTDTDVKSEGLKVAGSGATTWNLSASFDAAVELNTYRQDFDGSCRRFEAATGGAELVSDGGVNAATCDGGIHNFTYRLELAQASPFLPSVTGQGLDIDNDGADNAGIEILVAASLDGTVDHSYYIRGQSPAMFARFNITIASISGTDDFVVGWRLSEAFDATATSTNYDTWAVHRLSDGAGNLQIATDVNGTADGADENAINAVWADAETITFEVQLDTACAAAFYTDGALNAVTNANDACEVGDIMIPFIMQRNTTDADPETVVNWIEIGEVI